MFGAPQIAAILVLAQRGFEEIYSSANTKRLLAEGAREVGAGFYPVVAATHLGWIASLFLLISPNANVTWPLLVLYLLLQVARYWVIGSLGRYWTHRIITLDGAPIVKRGPYKFMKHPNYVITLVETFLLPLAFGAWGLALIMTAIWAAVLRYKILLEDAALATRRLPAKDKPAG
ncbi:MAG: isoprenylcysteine carboxyl methyltransferase family protein [Methyloligellaceae bacterium]